MIVARRDIYHDAVRQALVRDGWIITADPLILPFGDQELYADLGAEKIIGAEKGEHKIAVEIKSFVGRSDIVEMERTIGQHLLYESVLAELEPTRALYVAVTQVAMERVFTGRLGRLVLARTGMRLLVFEPTQEVIVQWIP